MTDLPPPPPGQQPAWQPPAGPPPSPAPSPSPSPSPSPAPPAETAPIRPYLPDPRAPKPATPATPADTPSPAPVAAPPTPPTPAPLPPVPPAPSATPVPDAAPTTMPAATAGPSAAAAPPPPFTPSGPVAPPMPDPAATSRSRLPAIIGAVVALAIGAGAVLWITRGGDDDADAGDRTDRPDATATTAADEPAVSTVPPEPTPAPASTGPAVVLPTPAPTTAPASTAPAPLVPVLPAPPAPAGATTYADPAGWSIAVDPAWEFSQSDTFTGWFTGTGSDGFADNMNVTLEELPAPMTLDDYVVAAKGFISTSAADVAIVDERRFAGADGVEVHVITWTGSVGGGQPLAFIQAMTVTATRAYVATFTSQPARMIDLATTIGPYVVTVRGT